MEQELQRRHFLAAMLLKPGSDLGGKRDRGT